MTTFTQQEIEFLQKHGNEVSVLVLFKKFELFRMIRNFHCLKKVFLYSVFRCFRIYSSSNVFGINVYYINTLPKPEMKPVFKLCQY